KEAARRLFGRNAIARALGVKAKAMVSKSPVWREIAEELDLGGRKAGAARRPSRRVGLEIALEATAVEAYAPEDDALRREPIRLFQKQLPPDAAEEVIAQLASGQTTDDMVRQLLEAAAEQRRDEKSGYAGSRA